MAEERAVDTSDVIRALSERAKRRAIPYSTAQEIADELGVALSVVETPLQHGVSAGSIVEHWRYKANWYLPEHEDQIVKDPSS